MVGPTDPPQAAAQLEKTTGTGEVPKQAVTLYGKLTVFMVAGTLLLTVLLLVWMLPDSLFPREGAPLPLVVAVAVMAAGVFGALVSTLTRLRDVETLAHRDTLKELTRLPLAPLLAFVLIPPTVGAISALALYMVFAGGMLSGGMFPAFDCAIEGGCSDFSGVLGNWRPASPPDYFKAVTWGFVAGFSERFVPSLLNSFIERREKK